MKMRVAVLAACAGTLAFLAFAASTGSFAEQMKAKSGKRQTYGAGFNADFDGDQQARSNNASRDGGRRSKANNKKEPATTTPLLLGARVRF